jgi:hypothetical protein
LIEGPVARLRLLAVVGGWNRLMICGFNAGENLYKVRHSLLALLALVVALGAGCTRADNAHVEEEEAESRTEFTDRVENFFEYAPLKAGKESQFLIHLTDLSDGSPVEKAEVVLTIRNQSSKAEIGRVKAKVGRVTGIYVADVTIPSPGVYEVEFQIKNAKLDERMPLSDFHVE